ncbi:MAG: divalent-cation tolerance protein CutA [Saprospiraceae bacterium]
MEQIVIIYVTFPNEESARHIGSTLLEEKLIACFNYFPMTSMYWWEEKIEEANEYIGLMKTTESFLTLCKEKIASLHPYDVPCVLSKNWTSNEPYFDWVGSVLKNK